MKNITTFRLFSVMVLASALGFGACSAQSGALEGSQGSEDSVADTQQALATCTTDCSATGGPPITKTCNTCSATSSSITCNGVTTYCSTPLRPCRTSCGYGNCGSCDDEGYRTTCYIYNGCGGKYPIP